VEQFIIVDTRQNIDKIKAELDNNSSNLIAGNIIFNISEDAEENLAYLLCAHPKDISAQFKRFIAEVIAGLIINNIEGLLANSIFEQNYCFPVSEREDIFHEILQQTGERGKSRGYTFLYRMYRRRAVLNKLLDYLTTADMIIIKGFIRFRLKDYLNELAEIVDKAVDSYLLEKDYFEFIRLLRQITETNDSKIDFIHVVFDQENIIKLFDKYGKAISSGLFEKAGSEQGQEGVCYDDLLINLLILLVPKKIMFHSCGNVRTASVQKMIRDIFNGQLKECTGCDLCLKI
jgi:putative sporulation protein YtxC